MKIKKEYIILILIIIALSGYLYFKRADSLHYELPAIPSVDTAEITKMDIIFGGKSLSLVKKDETWYLDPKNYPVDGKKIDAMLAVLKDLSVTEMVSESENYLLYELDDDNKIAIKAYAGSAPVREFHIGKTAATYRHTYIMLAGDSKVYQAKGNFREKFELSSADLRDKKVLAFNKDEIKSLKITMADKVTTLTREDIPQEDPQENTEAPVMNIQWKDQTGAVVEEESLDNFLNKLSALNCKEYLEDKTKTQMGTPVKDIVLDGTVEYRLSVYAKDGDATPVSSSLNDYVFILEKGILENIEKGLEELTKTPDKS